MTTEIISVGTSNGADPTLNWLESLGVMDVIIDRNIDINKIDEKGSRTNQARPLIGAIDDDHVVGLMESIENNEELPPILLRQMRGGKYKILDGNHRHRAWQLMGWRFVPAYVIKRSAITEQQEKVITYTANIRHALPTSLEQRISHAVTLIKQYGLAATEAGRLLHVPADKITYRLRILETGARMEELGLHHLARKLGSKTKERLGSIRNDTVLTDLTKLTVEANLDSTAVGELVKEINKTRSEKQALTIVANARESVAEEIAHTAGGKIPKPRPIAKLERVINGILKLDLDEDREALKQITADQRVTLKQRTNRAIEALQRLEAVI